MYSFRTGKALQSQLRRDVEHTLYRFHSLHADAFFHFHERVFIFHAVVQFFESVQTHIVALVACACAGIRRSRNEVLFRSLLAHFVQYACLCCHDEVLAVRSHSLLQQGGCRAHNVGNLEHRSLAFGVCQHQCVGILLLQFHNLFHRELFVHVACAVPQQHVAASDGVDIVAQIAVGAEDDFLVLRQTVHNLLGIGRCHHNVGHCLCGSRCVDIRYHGIAGVLCHKLRELFCRAAVGKRAACVEVGHEHFLFGAENLRCFAHEVHAAHHNHVGICLGSPLCQCQAVADEVGNVLYLASLVVVSQNHRILFFLQSEDGLPDVRFVHRLVGKTFLCPFFFYHIDHISLSSVGDRSRFPQGLSTITTIYYFLSFLYISKRRTIWWCIYSVDMLIRFRPSACFSKLLKFNVVLLKRCKQFLSRLLIEIQIYRLFY